VLCVKPIRRPIVAGNKASDWSRWYKTTIPIAEIAYEGWLALERKRRAES
jgi:hypothetical protein